MSSVPDSLSCPVMKIRLPSGNLAVYVVQPQHVHDPELIRMYGNHRATQMRGDWYHVSNGAVHALCDKETARQLDAAPIDFEVPHKMWGIQVGSYQGEKRELVWSWVHPTNGSPYQYHTKEEAERMRDMCYREQPLSKVRVYPFD